jgi:flagellar assembly factor FliW
MPPQPETNRAGASMPQTDHIAAGKAPPVIYFPGGLPGFPGATRFVLRRASGPFDAFLVMQSAEDPDLRFLMLPCANGTQPLRAADLEAACAAHGLASQQVAVLLVVSRQPAEEGTDLAARLCANLRAPVLIDTTNGIAVQHVLDSPGYSLRTPLPQAA